MTNDMWTLTRCDPEPDEEHAERYQIGFDVADAEGRSVHTVTTIYAADLPQNTREQAIVTAKRELKRQREPKVVEPQGEPAVPWSPPSVVGEPEIIVPLSRLKDSQ